ncbi:hypothetical protein MUCCIDRAFT_15544, partial [Mucor lusitanicus CBS 277.49]
DDVTTIFVVGFPEDMAEREFQNMFTFCHGFEAASLKWHCKDQDDDSIPSSTNGKKQMIGFARFRTRLEALEAIDVLSGKKIDQEKGTVLKAEMAKKNLHIKRGSATQTSTSTSSSTTTSTAATVAPQSVAVNSTTSPNTSLVASSLATSESSSLKNMQQRYDSFSPLPSDLLSPQDYKTDLLSSPIQRLPNPADQNPPCNTLYVGNLPPNTSEEELRQVFSLCKGYRRMCFRTKPQGPMCFVEFEDIVFASQALNELQGHNLTNSVKGGIRLSY